MRFPNNFFIKQTVLHRILMFVIIALKNSSLGCVPSVVPCITIAGAKVKTFTIQIFYSAIRLSDLSDYIIFLVRSGS
jgi:hypothetical protein